MGNRFKQPGPERRDPSIVPSELAHRDSDEWARAQALPKIAEALGARNLTELTPIQQKSLMELGFGLVETDHGKRILRAVAETYEDKGLRLMDVGLPSKEPEALGRKARESLVTGLGATSEDGLSKEMRTAVATVVEGLVENARQGEEISREVLLRIAMAGIEGKQ